MKEFEQKLRFLANALPKEDGRRIVLITGARQTGKTTLVKQFYANFPYINLDAVENRNRLRQISSMRWGKDIGKAVIDEAFGEKCHNIICHLANSGGICYFPETYFDMVRPGLLAFGYFPGPVPDDLKSIRPFFSLKAKIAYFKVVEANTGISYSHRYKTQQKTRIVTVPVSYGDGYRRALSNCAEVLIQGKRYPIASTICMDQFMADIGHDKAHVGEEVTLIGEQADSSITVDEIAQLCETIPYEIICGFTARLPRYYID